VGELYSEPGHPDQQDWIKWSTDTWLAKWRTDHSADITAEPHGFSGAFGKWALGSPSWNCRDDGDTTSCGTETVCDNRVLADKGEDTRQAYYVLEGLSGLHTYFTGTREAFETADIAAALAKDSWVGDFYRDKDVDDKAAAFWKDLAGAIAVVTGIAGAFAKEAGAVASALTGAAFGFVSNHVSAQ
jgi:hypothetical protein